MLHEERTANILINKAGGNAGPDANGYRVALPSAWMKALGISEGSRTVTLQFDGESITSAALPCLITMSFWPMPEAALTPS